MRERARSFEFVGSFTRGLPDLRLPEVAFAGRSNVGKSSALNRLLATKKAARVSATPGRTQAVHLYRLGAGDGVLVFADLPGYGHANVPRPVREGWKGVIEEYLATRDPLRMVVVLVDARLPLQEADAAMIEALDAFERPTLVVATKVDKLGKSERKPKIGALAADLGVDPEDVVPFSAVTGEGTDEVWERIEHVCT